MVLNNKRVRVYLNYRTGLFSVLLGGKVVHRCKDLHLKDVKFIVRESGRQRVLSEQRKNVHAFVEGTIVEPYSYKSYSLIKYNPYINSTFINNKKSPIFSARKIHLYDKKIRLV